MPIDDDLAVELIGRTDHGRVATSMRAMPLLASARHVVVDGRVLLRMHRGWGYHRACAGNVVAYGTDNLGSARPGESLWSVQIVGRCETVEPTAAHRELFGPPPRLVDGEPFDPVYLGIEPQFSTVHSLDDGLERQFQHVL
ncbi:pyridoxamine 5'-phosphate oxidase family protein [Streptomyces sp. NBC_01136]|uniref:pyridoxamine 5'-phosphate oxidase family protein n=1 Tax=Streptomyces sp. NBC_01136 TaxID=2903754 RepID=UPI0038685010|nr:pyridoxamine 5'-phosphate oxidase family protein [Streptomyces sp. NBC_01136]